MKSMKNLNTELTYREHWAKVDIRRDIQSEFVTIAICDLYDTSDTDIKKSSIRIHLEKWRKV